jgi:hypothetical protein
MMLKARGLAQNGGLPGWLKESNPAGLILYEMDGLSACLVFTVPIALTGGAHLPAVGISSFCYIANIHSHLS